MFMFCIKSVYYKNIIDIINDEFYKYRNIDNIIYDLILLIFFNISM